MPSTGACANCGAAMHGEYCAACGQRRFRAEDRRLGHLFVEFLHGLTDLDGRLWRSLRALALQPGRIASDWSAGRRAAWISPIRLFLLANLLYFLAPVLTDLSLPLHNQVRGEAYRQLAPERCVEPAADPRCTWGGQMHSRFTEPVFLRTLERERARAEARGRRFDPTAFEYRYNARSEAIGKLLVIVHVPFLALALALLAWRRRLYYAEHFVVALGLVTFVLLLVPLGVSPLAWLYALLQRTLGLSGGSVASILGYAALAVVLLHFAQACRRCYGSRWPTAALQGLLAFVALGATSLLVYRPLQFLLALWTL